MLPVSLEFNFNGIKSSTACKAATLNFKWNYKVVLKVFAYFNNTHWYAIFTAA